MKRILLPLLLAGVIALGALDIFFFSGQPSTSTATAGSAETTLAAEALPIVSSGCWVPGDLIGDANPANIRCSAP